MNKIVLMGRLTKDPEMRYTGTNKGVCSFSLAVNRRFAKQGEEPTADFFNIVTWEKTAEFCNNYFKKGQQVAVIGRLQNRSWDDAEGKKRIATEIVADEAYFADTKRDSYGAPPSEGGSKQKESSSGSFMTTDDNDLPF